ncbi:hypothetical protein [Streptomyces sp. Inha503]|uniref:hypothetical protein n=1 Tax=Streptomyces sp. Inha503 TaxID=3383314 RepID=UPI00399EF278
MGPAREMRRHFFFTPIRDDFAIGADLRNAASTGTGPDISRYPYATCELGGGMAIAHHRRPLVPEADVTSLALTKLGSGSVWQGYYLYHGCSQRVDLKEPNQETHQTGYPKRHADAWPARWPCRRRGARPRPMDRDRPARRRQSSR